MFGKLLIVNELRCVYLFSLYLDFIFGTDTLGKSNTLMCGKAASQQFCVLRMRPWTPGYGIVWKQNLVIKSVSLLLCQKHYWHIHNEMSFPCVLVVQSSWTVTKFLCPSEMKVWEFKSDLHRSRFEKFMKHMDSFTSDFDYNSFLDDARVQHQIAEQASLYAQYGKCLWHSCSNNYV
jgi:hypothetical protein